MKNLFVILCLFSNTIQAQVMGSTGSANMMLTDNMGRVLRPSNASTIDGSPYFKSDWGMGTVNSNGDRIFSFKKMKFNWMQNQLEHEYNDVIYALTDEIKEFEITSKNDEGVIVKNKFKRNFAPIGDFTNLTFYELLYDGKIKLLKKVNVRTSTHPRPLSTQTETSYFQTNSYFYCDVAGKLHVLQKGKEGVLVAINDQKEGLEALIKKEKLSMKIEADIATLLMLYETSLLKN